MSLREEDRQKNGCPSRGLGLAAAAIGVGVGAALYYFFSKRPENPSSEGASSENWHCESPQTLYGDADDSYSTISVNTTTDTSFNDSSLSIINSSPALSSSYHRVSTTDEEGDDDDFNSSYISTSTQHTRSSSSTSSLDSERSADSSSSGTNSLGSEHSADSRNSNVSDSWEREISVDIEHPPRSPTNYRIRTLLDELDALNRTDRRNLNEHSAESSSSSRNSSDIRHNANSRISNVLDSREGEISVDLAHFEHPSRNPVNNRIRRLLDELDALNRTDRQNLSEHSADSSSSGTNSLGSEHSADSRISNISDSWEREISTDLAHYEHPPRSPVNYRIRRLLDELTALNRTDRRNLSRERRWSLEECSICFEVILRDQEVMALPCTHNFHQACILPWLQQQQTCPNCRKKVD